MEAARAERFLNSRRRAKNPADALCTREEGACPEKEAERTRNAVRERDEREEIKMFGISFRRTRGQKRLCASVIFSENNVGQPTVA